MSDFDRDKSRWRRGINHATCAARRWVGAIDRSGSDPTVHGQWVDANLLGELPLVEPGVPELTNELIDLGLVAAPARTLDVMHPSPSPGLHQIGNHGVHRTLTLIRHPTAPIGRSFRTMAVRVGFRPLSENPGYCSWLTTQTACRKRRRPVGETRSEDVSRGQQTSYGFWIGLAQFPPATSIHWSRFYRTVGSVHPGISTHPLEHSSGHRFFRGPQIFLNSARAWSSSKYSRRSIKIDSDSGFKELF